MPRRKILVGLSIAGHAALFAGVFIGSVWDLDQLDHESRSRTALAVMTPPSAEAGSYTPPKVELNPKQPPKKVVNEPRQPRKPQDQHEITTPPGPSEPGTGTSPDPGSGPGDGDGPPAADPCKEPSAACGTLPAAPPPELPKPPPQQQVQSVAPQVLRGLRQRGETAIHPPRDVVLQMIRAGDLKTKATIKLCLAADGTVASVTLIQSTKYAAYDDAITSAARRWIYKPYAVNGTPVPACGVVTFLYEMK